MPQLCIETYVTQFVWFIGLFLFIYWFNTTNQLPKISEILFVRDQLSSVKLDNNNSKESVNDSFKINIVVLPQRSH